ncbi:uncharacterized protein LOC133182697 [Saccostrea echinata]|uniref:uncharacterized protein LOC133182697 n=1 Tax=Saccostrea echinata TaxID=191078 RepID=UPI002A80E3B4|nr:uncharacterized protein LOC133182697 [Saccostrea echinata]
MVLETNKKLDSVLEKLNKLDKIESELDKINKDISKIDNRMLSLEKVSGQQGDSLNFMAQQIEDLNKVRKTVDVENLGKEMKRQEKMIELMSRNLENIRRDRDEMSDQVSDLQWRSMKSNLVFSGLGGETNNEDNEAKLRDFLQYELGIGHYIQFGNVHRFGKHIRGKNRPIVARFLYNKERDMVKDRGYMLKNKPYGIREQFPAKIEDRRKQLLPEVKRLREEGNRVKLVRDKLIVNGELYNPCDGGEDFMDYEVQLSAQGTGESDRVNSSVAVNDNQAR